LATRFCAWQSQAQNLPGGDVHPVQRCWVFVSSAAMRESKKLTRLAATERRNSS